MKYMVWLMLAVMVCIVALGANGSQAMAQATSTPTPTAALYYHVFENNPGDCAAYTATPQVLCGAWGDTDSGTMPGSITLEYFVCVYTDTSTLEHSLFAESSGLSPDTSLYLYRGGVSEWEVGESDLCAEVAATAVGADVLHPNGVIPQLYKYGAFAAGGNGSYCTDPDPPDYANVELELWDDTLCDPTSTPTPTPTSTQTPTPTLTALPDTPQPQVTDQCIDVSYIYPWATRLNGVNSNIDQVNASISVSDTLFSNVTVSGDPISMAKGFVMLVADVGWLKILTGFFTVAFTVMLVMAGIRFIVSMWGLVERMLELLDFFKPV